MDVTRFCEQGVGFHCFLGGPARACKFLGEIDIAHNEQNMDRHSHWRLVFVWVRSRRTSKRFGVGCLYRSVKGYVNINFR